MRNFVFALLTLVSFSSCAVSPARPSPRIIASTDTLTQGQITAFDFDWDDNIFFMPTKIVLFKKGTHEEVEVSTAEFAHIRTEVGKTGRWADYEMRNDDATGSFRYFRDGPGGENYFLRDLKEALLDTSTPPKWKGPSWNAFVRALSREQTAKWTTIITARGHSTGAMIEGLQVLQKLGLIKYLPPEENLYAVSHPKYRGNAANPSEMKAMIEKEILDKIQAQTKARDMIEVVDQDGQSKKKLHLWGFSDDDFGNYSVALDALSAEVKKGRWPDVKIVLFFTGGKNNPKEKSRVTVIKSDGTNRPASTEEVGESERVICQQISGGLLKAN